MTQGVGLQSPRRDDPERNESTIKPVGTDLEVSVVHSGKKKTGSRLQSNADIPNLKEEEMRS